MKTFFRVKIGSILLLSSVVFSTQSFAAEPLVVSPDGDPSTWQRIDIPDRHKVEELWDKYNFTPEAIRGGERLAPRIYLGKIPARWGQTVAPGLTVRNKKITFLFALAPMVLSVDEEIRLERKHLQSLITKQKHGKSLKQSERDWLQALADYYGVNDNIDSTSTLNELVTRVDIIPASLVLAQAAVESGWGTSRFAAQGSALFGQWTYAGNGIKPKEQRTATKGDYQVQAFADPKASIRAYMLNLNTHQTYTALRQHRQSLRTQGKPVTGLALAFGLRNYSERGEAYVKELRELIKNNNLELADAVTLRKMTPILLIPVGEGVN